MGFNDVKTNFLEFDLLIATKTFGQYLKNDTLKRHSFALYSIEEPDRIMLTCKLESFSPTLWVAGSGASPEKGSKFSHFMRLAISVSLSPQGIG